jgi:hypothetical protein
VHPEFDDANGTPIRDPTAMNKEHPIWPPNGVIGFHVFVVAQSLEGECFVLFVLETKHPCIVVSAAVAGEHDRTAIR